METATSIFAFENKLIKEMSIVSSLPGEAANKYHPKKILKGLLYAFKSFIFI